MLNKRQKQMIQKDACIHWALEGLRLRLNSEDRESFTTDDLISVISMLTGEKAPFKGLKFSNIELGVILKNEPFVKSIGRSTKSANNGNMVYKFVDKLPEIPLVSNIDGESLLTTKFESHYERKVLKDIVRKSDSLPSNLLTQHNLFVDSVIKSKKINKHENNIRL